MSKELYLITTKGCVGCKTMDISTKCICNKYKDITRYVYDFTDKTIPEFIYVNVVFKDFPILIFVKDNTIVNVINGSSCSNHLIAELKRLQFIDV